MKILVTGGAGYIGSHTVIALIEAGFEVVVYDNLCNASFESIRRVEEITKATIPCVVGDIRDKRALANTLENHCIEAVIHLAALKAVGESAVKPLDYYQNNVHGTLCLLEVLKQFNINQFVFSSSATVYGENNTPPYQEDMPLGQPSSPYGTSKVMVEQILKDMAVANSDFRGVSLRYFNPIGAHESGSIGEDPKGIPNNLLPYVAQVAVGIRDKLSVYGDDYPTKDGSCERDYLHVMDLAQGHVAALKWLVENPEFTGVENFNLGTGKPVSVFEIVLSFTHNTQVPIPYDIVSRRVGDLPAFWADASKAHKKLNWKATRQLDQMIVDTWRWQSNNPKGYG